jgi:Holliday junction DNA helicase RuvA
VIGLLRGSVVEIEGNLALIEVSGVGYEVIVPDSALGRLAPKSDVTLYTRQIFREDGVTLCGFLDRNERRVFDLLLEVKGCGPKVAQALIGQVGADAISTSIIGNDAKTLSRATGVGQRLAERIILELKPKIEKGAFVLSASGTPIVLASPDRDLVEALVTLGYRRQDADATAAKIDSSLPLDERIKRSLQLLKKG